MTGPSFVTFLFGQLSWGALPFVRAWRDPNVSEIIGARAGAVVVFGVIALITWLRAWEYLWTEWFTSLNHKKIGIMYVVLAGIMLSQSAAEQLAGPATAAVLGNDHRPDGGRHAGGAV